MSQNDIVCTTQVATQKKNARDVPKHKKRHTRSLDKHFTDCWSGVYYMDDQADTLQTLVLCMT